LQREEYTNDTAWLKDAASSKYYLAVKQMKSGSGRGRPLGVIATTNLAHKWGYSSFHEWVRSGGSPISGLWQGDGGIVYILSTVNQAIKGILGTDSSGNRPTLYLSNQNSSMQRRVSMFVVPASN